MKKQILLIVTIIALLFFSSCKKENIPASESKTVAEQAVSITTSTSRPIPLTYKLDGWYSFDQTLKDQTGKLADALPSSRAYSFGKDRKGNLKGAIYFDSTYGVSIIGVPQQTNTSISAWVKYVYPRTSITFLAGFGPGPHFSQVQNQYYGEVEVDNDGTFGAQAGFATNNAWHHIVVTYDGVAVKLYADGILIVTYNSLGTIAPQNVKYFLAKNWMGDLWRGYVDDLRFYSRTLSASDVTALYNL